MADTPPNPELDEAVLSHSNEIKGQLMDAKLNHLEFIQSVISRMSTSSFLFKGWAITIAAGLASFGSVKSKETLLLIAIASTCLFWGLDGYYLRLERAFIDLYEIVAKTDNSQINFSMKYDRSKPFRKWLEACKRPHLCTFYGVIVALEVVSAIYLGRS
jgi:hypothetical protein